MTSPQPPHPTPRNLETSNTSQSHPDVILRPPITSQPCVTSFHNTQQWTDVLPTPVPPEPPGHQYQTVAEVQSDSKHDQCRDSVSIAGPMGSRNWSRDLFAAFKDLNVKPDYLLRALKKCKYHHHHHVYCPDPI